MSLATVAIASLGGPVPAATSALTQVVKFGRGRYEASAPTRDLQRQVTAVIEKWAGREHFGEEDVRLGLALATETFARYGLDSGAIADLNFDPTAATARVLQTARAADPFWGREDHYAVAERALSQTYGELIRQLAASETILLPAITGVRSVVDELAAKTNTAGLRTEATLNNLAAALVEAATVAEVMSYLRTRIADWNVSIWHPGHHLPAELERRLQVRATGPGSLIDSRELTAEEALAGERMLVILSGPGSGKTWLAHRYAREAAQSALQQLEQGADLGAVEVPLLTTWDQWARTPGPPRESLVEASFAADLGHTDLGGGGMVDRLRRSLKQRDRKVLLLIDSLDEAADRASQVNRLRVLTELAGWRVVVTSRPAAWQASYSGGSDDANKPQVVDLQKITYPDDVESFIRAWFVVDPERGQALIDQIRSRADLAQVAVVPLMLTFYCLLTEEPAAGLRPLPAHRHDLYARLVRRLLRGRWTANAAGPDTAPDMDYCEGVLREWAWQAVERRVTPVGLGDWGDSFLQSTTPREREARALDHVAPKVAEDAEGRITRRFVHRTVLEHFVVEHLARLGSNEAAEVLLPHLWFDSDWSVVAPAALAAHNRRDRGALLQRLLHQTGYLTAHDPWRQAAAAEFDKILLMAAENSDPTDWDPDHQFLLHNLREENAAQNPAVRARTAHWTESNERVFVGLLAALPTADLPVVGDLVAALPPLGPTEAKRAEARARLLAALPTADLEVVARLVAALPVLCVTEAERAEARAALLTILPTTVTHWAVARLVAALRALRPAVAERTKARSALLAARLTPDTHWVIARLMATLSTLCVTEAERAEARAWLLAALPTTAPETVADLVTTLPALCVTEAEQADARAGLLAALPTTDPWAVADLVAGLSALCPTHAERAEARAALLAWLSADSPTTDQWVVARLVARLPALCVLESERAEARTALLSVPASDPATLAGLVWVLPALGAAEAERAEARARLLAALPTTHPGFVTRLVASMPDLGPTEAERAEARAGLLAALSTDEPATVADLARALPALGPTEGERAEARARLLAALSTTDPVIVAGLARLLPPLGPTEAERAEACGRMLAVLPTTDPETVAGLAPVLPDLCVTEAERAEARAWLLAALPSAEQWASARLVAGLRYLSPMQHWLAWLCPTSGADEARV